MLTLLWRRTLTILVAPALVVVMYSALLAQTIAHVKVETIAPRPEDVTTLDGMIKAFYETISGPKGQPRHQQHSAFL